VCGQYSQRTPSDMAHTPIKLCTFDDIPSVQPWQRLVDSVNAKLVAPGVVECNSTLLGFNLHMRSGVEVLVIEPTCQELIHVTVQGMASIPVIGVIEMLAPESGRSTEKPLKINTPKGGEGRRVRGLLFTTRNYRDDAVFKVAEYSTAFMILEALADAEKA
jgi:hypothetical protein